MQQETITLSTGETLIVERNSTTTNRHEISLWSVENGKPDDRILTINKNWEPVKGSKVWIPVYIRLLYGTIFLETVASHKATIDAAAALAVELDASYPAGTEVT
jgi:hypothetical protein